MLCNGNGPGLYPKNGKGLSEAFGLGHALKFNPYASQLTVGGHYPLDEDSDSENALTSDDGSESSQGSSDNMDDAVWISEEGRRGLSSSSMKALEDVVGQVLKSVRAAGYGEDVCANFRDHFSRLPSRYTLNIDPQRHEDVLLHIQMLHEARERDCGSSSQSSYDDSFVVPLVHVRKVQLMGSFGSSPPTDVDNNHFSPTHTSAGRDRSLSLPERSSLPKPTFGSTSNLLGLGASPKVHPSNPQPCKPSKSPRPTPPRHSGLSSGGHGSNSPRNPSFPCQPSGKFVNPLHMEPDEGALAGGYASDHDDVTGPSFGYEVTVATTDKIGLLKFFASAISDLHLQLNITEAHVFSTADGMTLHAFVVEGWPGDEAEELRRAILGAVDEKMGRNGGRSRAQLRAAAEAIKYEDWAIDFTLLHIGERLGSGSTGQLFKGKYLSQDIAIKIIEMDDGNSSGTDGDTHRSASSAERLQIYKQEISIMRMIRHKNVVQFIGACSNWPQLCIVTELMAGGSVRDVLESRRSGLDSVTATKVLRDAARGMDFLHKRGIVHRDLKAANLLIDEYEVVKVCDFGVARLKPPALNAAGKSEKFSAEMTAETGTYRWMSPEVLEHKPYNHKADVYSFGITMWEVFTGEVPYSGLTPLQAAIGVVQRGLRPKLPRSSIPESLASLMQQCWHEEPRKRPEFSEVLDILETLVLQTPPKRVMYSTRKMIPTFLT